MQGTVLVCQHLTCRKQQSAAVLRALRDSVSAEIKVESTGCLGQCGNGPMVLILPEEILYRGVHPSDVPMIVKRHLEGGQIAPDDHNLKSHHTHASFWIGLAVFWFLLCLMVLLLWTASAPS